MQIRLFVYGQMMKKFTMNMNFGIWTGVQNVHVKMALYYAVK